MLRRGSLGQLLSMDLPQLQAAFPWLPEKALKVQCFSFILRPSTPPVFFITVSDQRRPGNEAITYLAVLSDCIPTSVAPDVLIATAVLHDVSCEVQPWSDIC